MSENPNEEKILEKWKTIEKGLDEIIEVVENGADKPFTSNKAIELYTLVYDWFFFFSCFLFIC
jgi:hypothetical protein